jgi:methionyl aminopeptidase
MIRLKTKEEIALMREGGKRAALIVDTLGKMVHPGVKAIDIDTKARELIAEAGGTASFLGYTPRGVKRKYPAAICVSINEEVVHGIPTEGNKVFEEGDMVKLDLGFTYQGLILDHARTFIAGKAPKKLQELAWATEEALMAGIQAARKGAYIGDIGAAVSAIGKKHGYGIVTELSGHGVGYSVHEEPFVPNLARAGTGPKIEVGLVIAIEPMFTLGGDEVFPLEDEYTFVTADRSIASHAEHTVAITEDGPVILTEL